MNRRSGKYDHRCTAHFSRNYHICFDGYSLLWKCDGTIEALVNVNAVWLQCDAVWQDWQDGFSQPIVINKLHQVKALGCGQRRWVAINVSVEHNPYALQLLKQFQLGLQGPQRREVRLSVGSPRL